MTNDFFWAIQSILANPFVTIPLWAMFLAQLLKIFYYGIKEKKLNFKLLFSTGRMPSSHSAMVSALATSIGLAEGFHSALFGLAFSFAAIVMYDAAGIRRAAGKQARILNRIMDDVMTHHLEGERLKELVGHTPFEVWAGMIFGILVAVFLYH